MLLLNVSYWSVLDVFIIENEAEIILRGRVFLNGVAVVERFGCDNSYGRIVIFDTSFTETWGIGFVVMVKALH